MASMAISNALQSKPTNVLFQLALKGVGFGYGTFTLGAFVLLAYVRKGNFRKLDAKGKKELSIARDKLWDLNKEPFGLKHRFCTLRGGIKLHYVESLPHTTPSSKTNLVIFIHGFPDSWYIWSHYLKSGRLREQAVMVAVDLPGYGGSDGLERYGAEEVLEALSEFVLKMRDMYIMTEEGKPRSSSRVVVVGHDWGALIAFRLASEAPQLADRFILSNSIHPALAYSNVSGRLASAGQMLQTWLHQPRNLKLLYRAASNLFPLFKQLRKSGYVFVFNLPFAMPNIVGNLGHFWFFRYLNAVSTHPDPKAPIKGAPGAELLASSIGPGEKECTSSPNGKPELVYSEDVRKRAASGGFAEKIRVYREGLIFNPWEKSLNALWDLNQIEQNTGRRQSSAADLFAVGPVGSLRAPTTVIWGKGDVAIENAIAIEGIGDFFGARSSQLILVQRCGHWAPLERMAIPIFEETIEWAVKGEKEALSVRFGDEFPMAKFVVERAVG